MKRCTHKKMYARTKLAHAEKFSRILQAQLQTPTYIGAVEYFLSLEVMKLQTLPQEYEGAR